MNMKILVFIFLELIVKINCDAISNFSWAISSAFQGPANNFSCVASSCSSAFTISTSDCTGLCTNGADKFKSVVDSVDQGLKSPFCGLDLNNLVFSNIKIPLTVPGYSGQCVLEALSLKLSLVGDPENQAVSYPELTSPFYLLFSSISFNWQGLTVTCTPCSLPDPITNQNSIVPNNKLILGISVNPVKKPLLAIGCPGDGIFNIFSLFSGGCSISSSISSNPIPSSSNPNPFSSTSDTSKIISLGGFNSSVSVKQTVRLSFIFRGYLNFEQKPVGNVLLSYNSGTADVSFDSQVPSQYITPLTDAVNDVINDWQILNAFEKGFQVLYISLFSNCINNICGACPATP